MRNLLLIVLFQLPLYLFPQQGSWSLYSDLGLNLSFNQMKPISGNADFLLNKKLMSGAWGIGTKFQFHKSSLLTMGIDHASYAYHYAYQYTNGAGAGSQSSVFIWGFPVGMEHIYLQNDCVQFSLGYGFKYRINRLGSPFTFESRKELLDRDNQIVFIQETKEHLHQQSNHLFAVFAYTQFTFKLSSQVQLGFKLAYNQGLNKHESFEFLAINRLPLTDETLIDDYKYSSRASYLSFGLSLSYIFRNKEKHNPITLPEKLTGS